LWVTPIGLALLLYAWKSVPRAADTLVARAEAAGESAFKKAFE